MKDTVRYYITLVLILVCAGGQTVSAQKLGKGFRLIANKDYEKAMEFFMDAKQKKIEQFATYYALSTIYGDQYSPYFKADQALLCIKNAQKHLKNEKVPEDFIKKQYGFDYQDVEVQYNMALFLVLNNIDKIEAITQLFRMGINGDYERDILEEKAYKCALQENTTISFSRFLEFYKDSKFAVQAKENYIRCWFEKTDNFLATMTGPNGGFKGFTIRYPESFFAKNCKTEAEYQKIKEMSVVSKDYQLTPALYEVIQMSDTLNLTKDDILPYYIANIDSQGRLTTNQFNKNNEFKVNNFRPRELDIAIGTKLFKTNKPTQVAKPKSTPSGKDFVMETYGDNPYAIKDFNRGRRAIAFYYTQYFDTDIDWAYFADTLEKIDFDDPRFKAAIARLQEDFPRAFFHDKTNSVGNNVFTRICGAEIVNNFGISDPSIFEPFEGERIPGSNMTFKSIEHYSSFRNPRSGRFFYYFISTTADSLVRGAYVLVPQMDSTVFIGYKVVNILPDNNMLTIFRSNCPGLVFYERKWRDLYYLVEEKKGNSSNWVVKKKYKRE